MREKKIVIDTIIDKLEKFAKENELKFIYALERTPNGSLVLYFTDRVSGKSHTIRISHDELLGEPTNGIIKRAIKQVKDIFGI